MERKARGPMGIVELSRREAQVSLLASLGMTNKEIAVELGLSEYTVKDYVGHALRKLNCGRRAELASYVRRAAGLA